VYEDERSFAFLDIGPVNLGHVLIVPKEHYYDFSVIPEAEVGELFVAVQRVAKATASAVGAPGFNIGINTGLAAGQVVMHAHVHVMPRFEGDGLKLWPKRDISPDDMEKAAIAIRQALS
jgi:histidine triad (HIT) family protein